MRSALPCAGGPWFVARAVALIPFLVSFGRGQGPARRPQLSSSRAGCLSPYPDRRRPAAKPTVDFARFPEALRWAPTGAVSSVGRAPARQAGGHWFEPSTAHFKPGRFAHTAWLS